MISRDDIEAFAETDEQKDYWNIPKGMIYIFDVDGTLTPSRGMMDREFANFFYKFVEENEVYIITGSDREKTLQQVPKEIYNLCIKVYQCSGNHVWQGDRELHRSDWELQELGLVRVVLNKAGDENENKKCFVFETDVVNLGGGRILSASAQINLLSTLKKDYRRIK